MPFKLPTTTPTPDEIFDVLLGHPERKLGHAELRALLYIVRRTFGFGKPADAVSLDQFLRGITRRDGTPLDYGCGITNRTSLVQALDGLEAKGLVRRIKQKTPAAGDAPTLYALEFEGDLPAVLALYHDDPRRGTVAVPPEYGSRTPRGAVAGHGESTDAAPTRNKRTNKQPRERAHHPDDYTGGKYGHRVEP